jgi:hypothetical protein
MFQITYEDLLRNPEQTTRLGLFLGLGDKPEHWRDNQIDPMFIINEVNFINTKDLSPQARYVLSSYWGS